MSDAFVPGPYALENKIVTACDGRLSICEVHDHSDTSEDHDSEEAHATGVLLAAAPALLEALRTAAVSLTACADLLYNANQDDKPAREDAYNTRKAIAQATGE